MKQSGGRALSAGGPFACIKGIAGAVEKNEKYVFTARHIRKTIDTLADKMKAKAGNKG